MKILFISESKFMQRFIMATAKKIMEEKAVEIDCLIISSHDSTGIDQLKKVFAHVYVNQYPKGLIKKIPKLRVFQGIYGLRKLVKSLPVYDIVHIQYHHYYYSYFTSILRKKARKLFISFYGSDFNETDEFGHRRNQQSLKNADAVFANCETFLEQIVERYKFSKQTGILIQLMNSFDTFYKFLDTHDKDAEKQAWGLNKKLIVCGYNAAEIVRHELIIDTLKSMETMLKEYLVIFPLTYGDDSGERRNKIKQKLSKCHFESLVLEEYLPTEKMQSLSLITDIFIHVQTVDSMSSSFLEHLVAGTVVITGTWLPYKSLIEKGMYFVEIESLEDLPGALISVLTNLEEHVRKSKVNRDIILNMMSWHSIKKNWFKYYDLH